MIPNMRFSPIGDSEHVSAGGVVIASSIIITRGAVIQHEWVEDPLV
jgi:hypothetical protein